MNSQQILGCQKLHKFVLSFRKTKSESFYGSISILSTVVFHFQYEHELKNKMIDLFIVDWIK